MRSIEVLVDNAKVKGFLLCDAVGRFCDQIKIEISKGPNVELATQIDQLFFPLQVITGSEEQFSFVVYALPRLTREERGLLAYKEYPDIEIALPAGTVLLTVDGFNKIDGMSVTGMKDVHSSLNKATALL
jgi:hypothetical protein